MFIIEKILKKKEERKVTKYLIKFQDYNTTTWQVSSKIPKFIIDNFEKTGATEVRKPKILEKRKNGTITEIIFSWEDGADGLSDWDPPAVFQMEPEERTAADTCNTEKDRDTRINRHLCGMLCGVYPCGICPLMEEIHYNESKSQVYGIFLEWLATIDVEKRPTTLLYDDACHLLPLIKKLEKVHENEMTKYFGSLRVLVDFMHFRNHKGEKCKKNCNPYDHPDLREVNSQACEQFFARSNKYRQVRSMNRESYITFWTYIIDLSNLRKEDKLRFTANPKSKHRMEYICDDICKMMTKKSPDADICDMMANVQIGPGNSSAADIIIGGGTGSQLGAAGPVAGLPGVAGHNPPVCSCSKRSRCATKRCECFKLNVKCSEKCHKDTRTCENK